MKVAFRIASVLYCCCIATVSAKMPLGLPGRRFVGKNDVKAGNSGDKSLHMGDQSNRTVVDDGTAVRGGDGNPPSNTPPSQKHAHKRVGFSMSPSSFAENGLCCVGDGLESMANGHVDASVNIRNGMVGVANGNVEASVNIRNGMDGASVNIRNGMFAIGVGMAVGQVGVCMVVVSWLGRS
jgi:hypothetical protein